MNFWKTFFWTSLSTGSNLINQFLSAKLIVIYGNAEAFGLIGQLQSFISLVQLGSGGIIQSGVIKYTAQYRDFSKQLSEFLLTSLKFSFYSSVICGLIISIFSKKISIWIFDSDHYQLVIIIFGLTLFGYTVSRFFLSALNGINEMSSYAKISFFSMILSVVCTFFFCYKYHIIGALYGIIIAQFLIFFVSVLFSKTIFQKIGILKNPINKNHLKNLIKFSIMSMVSAVFLPLMYIFLRKYVAYHSSWEEVGIWQSVVKISDAYLLLITTTLSAYALPKYTLIKNKSELRAEVFKTLIKVFLLSSIFAIIIFCLKQKIIIILFSDKFLKAQDLFLFQLLGDVIKVSSWSIANVLLSHAKIKTFCILEVFSSIYFISCSVLFFDFFGGIKGLSFSFFINYLSHFIICLIWFLFYTREKR